MTGLKERRALDQEFYPYANIFSRGWTVRFPRTRADGSPLVGGDTKSLTLRFAGPQGADRSGLGAEVARRHAVQFVRSAARA